LSGRRFAIAGIILGIFGCFFTIALLVPARRSARESARRLQCASNLRQIGLAMHNYHAANGCLPPAAITDKAGKPLLSWRVAILPYLEPSALSTKFHLDEPWDSPHNVTLIDQMPSSFACPSDATRKPGMTGYQVVVGPTTAFPPDFKPLKFEEITDGTSNTLLVGESRQTVPWTKPEDLSINGNIPLFGLGSHHGYHNNGFNVVFADGSVRFLGSKLNPETLNSLLTIHANDGPTVDSF
jgi:prepilin-type processing-associated H-X9-DG protein